MRVRDPVGMTRAKAIGDRAEREDDIAVVSAEVIEDMLKRSEQCSTPATPSAG